MTGPRYEPGHGDDPRKAESPGRADDPGRTDDLSDRIIRIGPTDEPPPAHRMSPPVPPAGPGGPDSERRSGSPALPVVELSGISVSYARRRRGRGHPPQAALHPVDLTLRRGELITLTGQPSAGMSTLLNVIGLLDRPTTGTYLLNGIDTARLGDRDRAALRGRQIGLVFQRLNLLPSRSALENVAMPLLYAGMPARQRRSAAAEMLVRVGVTARANSMTWQLSAGERQLVAIARALVTEPSLLLCDDPTASLGSAVAAQVIGLLARLNRDGKTVLIATEDQFATAYSSRSVAIGPGR